MNTRIYYYSGTGNSLWVARRMADSLGGAELASIARQTVMAAPDKVDILGLVFPVHVWGVPRAMVRFVEGLSGQQSGYVFAVAVNAGQVSNTLVQLQGLLAQRGMTLSCGFEVCMPSNYIPWGGPGPAEEQGRRFAQAREKIAVMAPQIRAGLSLPVEKGPLWQRIIFSAIYRVSFARVAGWDKGFDVDESCNRCGVCSRICPAANITLDEDGRPVWHHRCEQCFACLQWCPQGSIQYGRRSRRFERYHHPEVKLKDMLP